MGLNAYVCVWTSGPPDPTDRFVLLALASFLNDGRDDTEVWPSIPRLAQMTRLTPPTIKRAIRRLRKDGWVSVIAGPNAGHRANTYEVHFIPIPVEERDVVAGSTTGKTGHSDRGHSDPVRGHSDLLGGSQRPGRPGHSDLLGGSQRPPNWKGTGELNREGTGSDPLSAQIDGQDQKDVPPGSASSVVIPADEDVLAYCRTWPGDLTLGAPPGIPETWALDWVAFQFRKRKFPAQWQRAIAADFKRDFRGRVPKAMPGYRPGRATPGPASEPLPAWLASAAVGALK